MKMCCVELDHGYASQLLPGVNCSMIIREADRSLARNDVWPFTNPCPSVAATFYTGSNKVEVAVAVSSTKMKPVWGVIGYRYVVIRGLKDSRII